jgi:transposase
MAQQTPRRQYDKQFKMDAVELTLKGDKTTKEVADNLGVNPYVLYRWRSKYLAKKESAFPGTGNPKDSEAEKLRKLERELKIVTEEREILKKALAVFSR